MFTVKLVRMITNTQTGLELLVTDAQWETTKQLILAFGTSTVTGIGHPAIESQCCYFLSNQLDLELAEVYCIVGAVKEELYE